MTNHLTCSYSNKSKKYTVVVVLSINACIFRSLQQAEGQSCVEMHYLRALALIVTQKHDCPEEDIDFFTVY